MPRRAQHVADVLAGLDGDGAHQHRLAPAVFLGDVVDDGRELRLLRPIDLVVQVVTDDRLVGRHLDHVQVVDRLEFLFLGLRRAGHAGQLVVHAEEVLEGDGGQRHRFLLDLDAFLRLDGLVQALAVAATLHEAAGELVDDDDFAAVADDVVLVALVEGMCAQGVVQVGQHLEVLGLVEVLEPGGAFDVCHALLGERRHHLLLVDDEVLFRRQPLDHGGELHVVVRALPGLAGDDEGRARLVDEDVVHLVDDGIVQLALGQPVDVLRHVVAQVVEAELVVGAVGDVGPIGFPPRAGAQGLEAVVRIGIVEIEQEGAGVRVAGAVLDHPGGQPQQVVDGTHELQADLGQVVVGRDQVGAAAAEGVEIERQRGHERLAFAGLHFGDGAAVEDHAAQQLHVVVTQARGALAGLPHGGEGLGEDLPQHLIFGRAQLFLGAVEFYADELLVFGAQHLQVFLLDLGQLLAQLGRGLLDALAELRGHGAQLVGALALELRL